MEHLTDGSAIYNISVASINGNANVLPPNTDPGSIVLGQGATRTAGNNVVIVGPACGNTAGNSNVLIGNNADNVAGGNNVVIGPTAVNTAGNTNVIIGSGTSANNATGVNVVVGNGASSATFTGCVCLGNLAVATANNQLVLPAALFSAAALPATQDRRLLVKIPGDNTTYYIPLYH